MEHRFNHFYNFLWKVQNGVCTEISIDNYIYVYDFNYVSTEKKVDILWCAVKMYMKCDVKTNPKIKLLNIIKSLLQMGANPNSRYKNIPSKGNTKNKDYKHIPIICLTLRPKTTDRNKSLDLINLLLKFGAKVSKEQCVDEVDGTYNTIEKINGTIPTPMPRLFKDLPVHYKSFYTDDIYISVEERKQINVIDANGYTPLMYAIISKRIGNVNTLLKEGSDITISTPKGNTPLMICAITNFPKAAELIKEKATVDYIKRENHRGYNALQIAEHKGYSTLEYESGDSSIDDGGSPGEGYDSSEYSSDDTSDDSSEDSGLGKGSSDDSSKDSSLGKDSSKDSSLGKDSSEDSSEDSSDDSSDDSSEDSNEDSSDDSSKASSFGKDSGVDDETKEIEELNKAIEEQLVISKQEKYEGSPSEDSYLSPRKSESRINSRHINQVRLVDVLIEAFYNKISATSVWKHSAWERISYLDHDSVGKLGEKLIQLLCEGSGLTSDIDGMVTKSSGKGDGIIEGKSVEIKTARMGNNNSFQHELGEHPWNSELMLFIDILPNPPRTLYLTLFKNFSKEEYEKSAITNSKLNPVFPTKSVIRRKGTGAFKLDTSGKLNEKNLTSIYTIKMENPGTDESFEQFKDFVLKHV